MHAAECHDDLQVLGQYHGAYPPAPSLNFCVDVVLQREDLEFSVGSKASVWEVKDPLLAGGNGSGGLEYGEEDGASNYHGGAPASLVGGVSGQQLYSKRAYPPQNERY